MNTDVQNSKKPECPNMADLLENWNLRHELARERKRREAANVQSALLFIAGCLSSFLLALTIMHLIIRTSMNAETAEICVRLTCACAVMFFAISVLLCTINSALNGHAKRKKEKNATNKKEGEIHV